MTDFLIVLYYWLEAPLIELKIIWPKSVKKHINVGLKWLIIPREMQAFINLKDNAEYYWLLLSEDNQPKGTFWK